MKSSNATKIGHAVWVLAGLMLGGLFGKAGTSLAAEHTWTQRVDMPTARIGHSASVVDGKIYIFGGITSEPNAEAVLPVEVYDPFADSWPQAMHIPTWRFALATAVVNGKIYVVGGYIGSGVVTSKVEEYNPATDTWTRKADLPGPRFQNAASVVDGKVYAIGGLVSRDSRSGLRTVEQYDPVTDTWTGKADMPFGVWGLCTSVVDGKIYALGGRPSTQAMPYVQEYDPATDTWTRKSDMPVGTSNMGAVALGDKIIVIGGWLSSGGYPYAAVQLYDPETDIWTIEGDAPFRRAAFSANVVNNRIYAIGGTDRPHPCPATSTVYELTVSGPPPDFNGDGVVDIKDLVRLMESWGRDDPAVDIGPTPYGDGIVDIEDLNVLAEYVDVAGLAVVHDPSSNSIDVPRDVVLNWTPGEFADTHDVYFGTVFGDVNEADRANPLDVLVSQGQAASTYDPGLLALAQTYYWRVDEVGAPPESTVYKGFVWNFTTEPVAYPLGNVSATASTSEAGAGPENTVNGSGLNDNDEHSTADKDMWLASGDGVDPVWIQYEFDNVYRLHEMLVWNYNVMFELMLGFGLKDVTVAYSENGMDWVVLSDVELAQATATSTYTANTTVDLSGVAARYVRLTVNSGWGTMGKHGLSEVRFLHIPTRARKPQPADGETGVSPDTVLRWHAGREAVAHDVYLSTDRQAVVDGAALVDTVAENSCLPGPLDPGQTYYWKINEINETEAISVWEGDVWEFTTAE